MLDAKIAAIQVGRLQCLNYPPKNQEGVSDLFYAIQAAHTEAIAVSVVNEWIERQADCPKPAHIRALIWEENEKHEARLEAAKPKVECPRCYNTGRVRDEVGYWTACRCPAGPGAAAEIAELNAEIERQENVTSRTRQARRQDAGQTAAAS